MATPGQKSAHRAKALRDPNTVYRVQNKQGVGPYAAGVWTRMGVPWPREDFDASMEGKRFAFERPAHAAAAYGRPVLRALKEHGFEITPVRASKVYHSKSGRQVAYDPEG